MFGAYVEAKQQKNVLNYDDLLLYWAGRVAEPTLAAQIGTRFDHVLVDEYQDTNRLQASILMALKPDGRGVTVVGIVTLERNYRSTQPILDVSLALGSQAVLFRTSTHSAALALELARRNIPFVKYGGLKFLEAAHVKDLLAVLRFAETPRGRMAGFRVTQMIPGIGPVTATRLLGAMDEAADPGIAVKTFMPPAAAQIEWQRFAETYAALRESSLGWPADMELALRWYIPRLERLHDDTLGVRRGDVEQLARLASGYASRERFLTELTLDPPEATSDRSGLPLIDEDYLILSTIHSAKGQEWNSVHVLNVVDGCMPADVAQGAQEIEEERRLLYVAMTRALHFRCRHGAVRTGDVAGRDHRFAESHAGELALTVSCWTSADSLSTAWRCNDDRALIAGQIG